MTRERIVFRVVERVPGRSGSFLPPGVGAGMDESGLVLVLNRTIRGPSKFRSARRAIVGTVTEETKDHVIIQRANGQVQKITKSDIIERVVLRS